MTLTTRSMQRGERNVERGERELTTRSMQRGERDVDNSVYAERRA